jgi:hypothetical protein
VFIEEAHVFCVSLSRTFVSMESKGLTCFFIRSLIGIRKQHVANSALQLLCAKCILHIWPYPLYLNMGNIGQVNNRAGNEQVNSVIVILWMVNS